MKLLPIEENIFDDLVQDMHMLWEWYDFFRHHHPGLSEAEVIEGANKLLAVWVGRNWLEVITYNNDSSLMSGGLLAAAHDERRRNNENIWLDTSSIAPKEVGKVPVMKQGQRYMSPDADPARRIIRVFYGFSEAHDELRRGPYSKISQNGTIAYVPLAGNAMLAKKT